MKNNMKVFLIMLFFLRRSGFDNIGEYSSIALLVQGKLNRCWEGAMEVLRRNVPKELQTMLKRILGNLLINLLIILSIKVNFVFFLLFLRVKIMRDPPPLFQGEEGVIFGAIWSSLRKISKKNFQSNECLFAKLLCTQFSLLNLWILLKH